MVRRILRVVGALVVLLVVLGGVLVAQGWRAFGAAPAGDRQARIERSPQWKAGAFRNPQPMQNDVAGMLRGMMSVSDFATPDVAPASVATDPRALAIAPASGLRITWFGHSTTLIEIDGVRVLTDAVFSERASPISWIGPKRYGPPAIALDALPPIDVVLVSHDHYDHLDAPTMTSLATRARTFVVPLGIGAHLESWGVPADRIVELDWWEHVDVDGLTITSTPARHASGRFLAQNNTLWSSFALTTSAHRVFFSGDTGLFPALKEIGARLGPFDVTLFEVGQYHKSWPDWHLGPEQAVLAHRLVGGRVFFPIHWGALTLAYHSWTEPAERVLAEAVHAGVTVVAPKLGESIEPVSPPVLARWWPAVPWETAAQAPVVAHDVETLTP